MDVHGEYMHSRENRSRTVNVLFVTDHTCLLSEVQPSHHNILCDFVAKQIYGLIMDNLNYEQKMIVRHIEQTYQYTISYLKAWRAKQRVFEMRFGTYEASYDNLPVPRLLLEILEDFMTHTSYW